MFAPWLPDMRNCSFRRAFAATVVFEIRDKYPRRIVVVRRKANACSRSRRVDAPGPGRRIWVRPDEGSYCDDGESVPSRATGVRCMFRLVMISWYRMSAGALDSRSGRLASFSAAAAGGLFWFGKHQRQAAASAAGPCILRGGVGVGVGSL